MTVRKLEKLIREEVAKAKHETPWSKEVAKAAKKTKEVDADEYAGTLEKKIDQSKAQKIKEAKKELKLKEARVVRYLNKIREARKRLAKKSKPKRKR